MLSTFDFGSILQTVEQNNSQIPQNVSQSTPQQSTFVFFHSEKEEQTGFLSNWYPCNFQGTASGQKFCMVEQYMMARKARAMGDKEAEKKIMEYTSDSFVVNGQVDWNAIHKTTGEIKALGREVKNFKQEVWDKHKFTIVKTALIYKFAQNEYLRNMLFATGDAVLVETSLNDRVWGIGFAAQDALANVKQWGENLLGKALMGVRTQLKSGIPDWAWKVEVKPTSSFRCYQEIREIIKANENTNNIDNEINLGVIDTEKTNELDELIEEDVEEDDRDTIEEVIEEKKEEVKVKE